MTTTSLTRSLVCLPPSPDLYRRHNMKHLKYLFLAGERLDPDTLFWAQSHVRVPVYDNYWQVCVSGENQLGAIMSSDAVKNAFHACMRACMCACMLTF